MSANSCLRCLVVEDQLMIQQLLMAMLQQHPALEVVGSASSVAEGIACCTSLSPDLVILDIALPDGDGLSVAHALADHNPAARVIVLSSFASTVERPTKLRSQIMAVLDKSRAYQDLIREVEALLPAKPDEPTQVTPDLTGLTPREREILELVGNGWSSRRIADLLIISQHTVETHRRNICSKLGLSGAALVRQASLLVGGSLAAPVPAPTTDTTAGTAPGTPTGTTADLRADPIEAQIKPEP